MRIDALDIHLDAIISTVRQRHAEVNRSVYALMETAMMIQELYDDMSYAQHINPDKAAQYDPYEIRKMFIEWADEFESRFNGDDRYENDYTDFIREFAEVKLMGLFGIELEDCE